MEIPERLGRRPQYRGMVLPFIVVMDDEGHADFRVVDMDRWFECINGMLCSMCGQRLDYWVWYIGGPNSSNEGVYIDLAMHEDCCFYSAAVCPFLRGERDSSQREVELAGYERSVHHEVVRSDVLFATKRRRDQVVVQRNGDGYIVKTGPEAMRVQLWPKVEQ